MADRAMLWNMAEWSEKRCNSTVARELEVALPVELPAEMREQLVHQMGNFIADRYNVAVDAAIHLPSKKGDERNHHAHLLFTTREVTRDGFGKKTRILDDRKTGSEEVKAIRAQWAIFVNAALTAMKLKTQVDHRSHKDRGIDMPPQIHVGVRATNAQRHGKELISFPILNPKSNKIINYPKIDHGGTRAQYNAEIIELQKYRKTETTAEKLARLGNQLVDLSGDIDTLRVKLNSAFLSDDLRAKIRLAIEKIISKVFLKQHEETEYIKRVKEAKQQQRKLIELESYYQRLIEVRKETQQKYDQEQANRKLNDDVNRMAQSLIGVPPYIIKLEIPLSAKFDEAAYKGYLRIQSVQDIQKSFLTPPLQTVQPITYLRKDVLHVKELLARGRPVSSKTGRISVAQNFKFRGGKRF